MSDAAIFLVVVIGCGVVSALSRSEPMARTCAAMLACFGVGILWRTFVEPDNQWPWLLYALIDTVGAWIVLRPKASAWQGWIGLCFLVQIAMNVGYGANYLDHGYSYDAQILAWQANSWIGNIKLLLLGGWAGGGIADYLSRSAGVLPHPAAGADRSGGKR